jgi:hypothetical protein
VPGSRQLGSSLIAQVSVWVAPLKLGVSSCSPPRHTTGVFDGGTEAINPIIVPKSQIKGLLTRISADILDAGRRRYPMRHPYRFGSGAIVVLVVLVVTIVGSALPASSDYYRAVYPPAPGDGNDPGGGGSDPGGGNDRRGGTDPGSILGGRLARAQLRWSFSPAKLTQYEPTRFTATITYDRAVSGRIILVAYENVASLRETREGEFDIARRTGASLRLDEGHSLPGGGYELSWQWDVIPKAAGKKTLELEIQPVIVINGSRRTGIQVRNEPVPISVRVHPNAAALKEVSSKAGELTVTLPAQLVAGEASEVSAVLPLQPHDRVVDANVTLTRKTDSVGASVSNVEQTVSAGSLIAKWSVTPTEAGTLDLLFHIDLSTQAGVETIKEEAETLRSVAVSAPPPPFWSRVVGFFSGINGVVVAVGGIIGLIFMIRNKWRRSGAPTDA